MARCKRAARGKQYDSETPITDHTFLPMCGPVFGLTGTTQHELTSTRWSERHPANDAGHHSLDLHLAQFARLASSELCEPSKFLFDRRQSATPGRGAGQVPLENPPLCPPATAADAAEIANRLAARARGTRPGQTRTEHPAPHSARLYSLDTRLVNGQLIGMPGQAAESAFRGQGEV